MKSHQHPCSEGAPTLMVLGALTLASLAGCAPTQATEPNAIPIGLLLPFTGDEAASGSNFEEAVLYAQDRINGAGGINGRPLEIISADTHSDVTRAKASLETLVEKHVLAVLGPESAEIAAAIKPTLDENGIVFVSPFVGAADDQTVDCTTPWFRLAPSASTLGDGLAELIPNPTTTSVALLHASDAYDNALAAAVAARFATSGGTVSIDITLDPNAQDYTQSLAILTGASADTIVLATSAETGALVVNEVSIGATPQWFLSPLLKTDVLIQNTAPQTLENALGVTPAIFDTSADFPTAFEKRWQGDTPLDGAYFYYDAMALLAFALTSVEGPLTPAQIEAAVVAVAGPPGTSYGWNQVETGLGELSSGQQVYYSGLTGPMLPGTCGKRQDGQWSDWTIQSGEIVTTSE